MSTAVMSTTQQRRTAMSWCCEMAKQLWLKKKRVRFRSEFRPFEKWDLLILVLGLGPVKMLFQSPIQLGLCILWIIIINGVSTGDYGYRRGRH